MSILWRIRWWLLARLSSNILSDESEANIALATERRFEKLARADREQVRGCMSGATTAERVQYKALRTAAEGAERWHRARARRLQATQTPPRARPNTRKRADMEIKARFRAGDSE